MKAAKKKPCPRCNGVGWIFSLSRSFWGPHVDVPCTQPGCVYSGKWAWEEVNPKKVVQES